MIKKLLMYCTVFLAGTAMMTAQNANIGLIGGSTSTDWGSDTDMVTTDGVTYTLNNVVLENPAEGEEVDAGVKFRQDDAWANNWGGTGFPAGTASPGGANIPIVNGTYNVTFNLTTLQYSFINVGFDDISLVGTGIDVALLTADGITYTANNVALPAGNVAFMINDAAVGWGSSAFPTGTAVSGTSIPALANSYNITFNKDTKAYSFNYVTISLIGDGIVDWDTDTDLSTTDGVNYMLSNFTFPGGEVKFRLNHEWAPGWGSLDFPSGTGSTAVDAPNIPVTAGVWNVSFNRIIGTYGFITPGSAAVTSFNAGSVSVYPNPSATAFTFNAGNNVINSIQLIDVTGKVVYTTTLNATTATVNATGLSAGMYFARLTSANATQTIRVVKN